MLAQSQFLIKYIKIMVWHFLLLIGSIGSINQNAAKFEPITWPRARYFLGSKELSLLGSSCRAISCTHPTLPHGAMPAAMAPKMMPFWRRHFASLSFHMFFIFAAMAMSCFLGLWWLLWKAFFISPCRWLLADCRCWWCERQRQVRRAECR